MFFFIAVQVVVALTASSMLVGACRRLYRGSCKVTDTKINQSSCDYLAAIIRLVTSRLKRHVRVVTFVGEIISVVTSGLPLEQWAS
ncbi:hypothetical protein M405DRAFT_820543 [Rhizopogon salebrosus TDB-379]|nr:hypothetical protein M405DRAFT_820543 [Rhizopogon salebrosus TDB-379]